MRTCLCAIAIALAVPAQESPLDAWQRHREMAATTPFADVVWTPVGPMQAGCRVEAIAVHPSHPHTLFVGVGSGNLWRSTNNGTTWAPVFEHESAFAIGDVAIAPSDPSVVWVGTGETQPRHSGYSYAGTGVFRSVDGGDTWQNMGLHESHHVGKVLVHPERADTALVAAIGSFWKPNSQRGVFRTTNGGREWQHTLNLGDTTGCVDLAAHERRPNVVLAAAWHHGGGPGSKDGWRGGDKSGIHRSTDGGATWTRINAGLPAGPMGRIGLAFAPSDPNVAYAFVDDQSDSPNDKREIVGGSLFRSNDAGATWNRTDADLFDVFKIYGWKFCDVHVAPDDPEHVFVMGNLAWISRDGGDSFERIGERIVRMHDTRGEIMHLDHHELWIDPNHPERLLLGNDGGLFQSWDGGSSWLHHNNIPAAEFYAVSVDDSDPFRVFGGTQDNAALYGPGNVDIRKVLVDPWENVYLDPWTGGDSFDTLLDPTDPRFVYYEHQHGALRRMDLTGESVQSWGPSAKGIRPRAKKGTIWRYGWHAPLLLSQHDPETLWMGGNVLLVTRDRAKSWAAASGELGEPATHPWGAVPFGTITAIAESPATPDTLVVGTEGGRIWLTTDGCKSWRRIDRDLPERWVTRVVASAHADQRLYVTMHGFRMGDNSSYVFVSDDMGATWSSRSAGLPAEPVQVLREDPTDPATLFVGTERGAFVSIDSGASWHVLGAHLPTTPVHDLVIHTGSDTIVAGTHGRSVWSADLKPLRARVRELRSK